MTTPSIVWLPAPGAAVAEVGGKALSLSRLLVEGLPVPPAFVVPVAVYQEQLSLPALRERAHEALAQGPGQAARLAALREALLATALGDRLSEEVRRAVEKLGGGPYAVRSSAVGEDGAAASFAGQYETVLNVPGAGAVMEAIRRCWASAWSDRAVDYRARRKLGAASAGMAVVVQRQVAAEAAGVVFTCDPVAGREDRLVVEAVRGLGESLVSGRASPDRRVLAREGLGELDGGTGPDGEVLDAALARRVAELGLRVERALGGPQDVEWAAAGGEVFLLQARPVTALARQDGSASVPPDDRTIWTNANAAEVLPGVVRPMTYSLVHRYVTSIFRPLTLLFGIDLHRNPLLGRVAGRVYFNLTTLLAWFRSIPGVRHRSAAGLARVFGGSQRDLAAAIAELDDDDLPKPAIGRLRLLAGALRIAVRLLRHRQATWKRELARARERTGALASIPPRSLSDAELAAWPDELARDVLETPGILEGALVGILCLDRLRSLCRRHLGEDGEAAAGAVLAGQGNLASAESGLAFARLSDEVRGTPVASVLLREASFEEVRAALEPTDAGRAFLSRWGQVLDQHGHHARGETDVSIPRWREQPDFILGLVQGWLAAPPEESPVRRHERRIAQRAAETEAIRGRLPGRLTRRVFDLLLGRVAQGMAARENGRSEMVRRIALMRESLLEAGRRLVARGLLAREEDVFLLELEELGPALSGTLPSAPRDLADARRQEHERLSRLEPPSVVVGTFRPETSVAPPDHPPGTRVLRGLAASPGIAEGPARVVLAVDEAPRVLPGEVLVAPFTDPGWTPYFLTAAALVMDFGGMLSHGCVVAREYGVPAVVNVGPATRLIRTGQRIRVDGLRGEVVVLDANTPPGSEPLSAP